MGSWTPSCDRFGVVTGPYSVQEHAFLIRHGFLEMTESGEYHPLPTITDDKKYDSRPPRVCSRRRRTSNYQKHLSNDDADDDDDPNYTPRRKLFVDSNSPFIIEASPSPINSEEEEEEALHQINCPLLDTNNFDDSNSSFGTVERAKKNLPLTSTPLTSPSIGSGHDHGIDSIEPVDVVVLTMTDEKQNPPATKNASSFSSPVCRPAVLKRRRTIFATCCGSPKNNNSIQLSSAEDKSDQNLATTFGNSLPCPNLNPNPVSFMPTTFNPFLFSNTTTMTAEKFPINTELSRPASTCPKSRIMTTTMTTIPTLPKLKDLP